MSLSYVVTSKCRAKRFIRSYAGVYVSHARRLKKSHLHWMQIPQNYLRDMSYLLDNCQIIVLQ